MARTTKTKRQRIMDLVAQGKSVPEIVKAVKSSPSYVYLVRNEYYAQQSKAGIAALSAEVVIRKQPTFWQKVKQFFLGE